MMLALTRPLSESFAECALTFREREPIDLEKAARQHREYESYLWRVGDEVLRLPPEPDLPDACFVEDTAVVVDEVAVITAPRLPLRAREVPSVAETLQHYRPLAAIQPPGTMDGGDVLRIDRRLYVGISERTNQEAADQLASLLRPHGYEVQGISFSGCLHLKSACTYIGRDTILANPDWVDSAQFIGMRIIAVDPDEPEAGNALEANGIVIVPQAFQRTERRLERTGFKVHTIDVSELQKAEAGVTCCSIRLVTGGEFSR